jgi:hypothetical protein
LSSNRTISRFMLEPTLNPDMPEAIDEQHA